MSRFITLAVVAAWRLHAVAPQAAGRAPAADRCDGARACPAQGQSAPGPAGDDASLLHLRSRARPDRRPCARDGPVQHPDLCAEELDVDGSGDRDHFAQDELDGIKVCVPSPSSPGDDTRIATSTPQLCTVTGYPINKNDTVRSLVMQGDMLFDVTVRVQVGSTCQEGEASSAAQNVEDTPSSVWRSAVVHRTIPGNGNGKYFRPTDQGQPYSSRTADTCTPACDHFRIKQDCCNYDGANEAYIKDVSMNFVQVEYGSAPIEVKIVKKFARSGDPGTINLKDVIITPDTPAYALRLDPAGHALIITIPPDTEGRRFSVEFKDDIKYYWSDGTQYVDGPTEKAKYAHGWEPENALLIFASPVLPPPAAEGSTTAGPAAVYTMTPGELDSGALLSDPRWNLEGTKTVYFPPGVYWMKYQGADHIRLGKFMENVHLDLGAYVKSAVEWTNTLSEQVSITGHGVLSGTDYVYQANPDCKDPTDPNDPGGCSDSGDSGLISPGNPHRCQSGSQQDRGKCYLAVKNDRTSLRMLWHRDPALRNQKFVIDGVVVASPPFNTHDFCWGGTCGADQNLSLQANDYKQVGAFFMQTDGLMPYSGEIRSSFLHVNDDGLKLYYSNMVARNLTFWKAFNDPVVQFGWEPRNLENISVESLDLIHARYIGINGLPAAIVGAAKTDEHARADGTKAFSAKFKDIRCETGCPPLYDINVLQNTDLQFESVRYRDGNLDQAGNVKWVSELQSGRQGQDGPNVQASEESVNKMEARRLAKSAGASIIQNRPGLGAASSAAGSNRLFIQEKSGWEAQNYGWTNIDEQGNVTRVRIKLEGPTPLARH